MESRLSHWEKYRTRIATSPEWTFKRKEDGLFKHSLDSKTLEGKGLSSKAISFKDQSKSPKIVGFDSYIQRKKTIMIAKFSLVGLALVIMIVWYVLWVR